MASSLGHPERPISSAQEDNLDRDQFVRRLTDALINPVGGKSTGVVVGITGPWGSGKSSILNLLQDHIKARHGNALVVRFDPWLVSGRNDLITEFISELLATIRAEPQLKKRLKGLAKTVTRYGKQLAPAVNYFKPGIGTIISSGLGAAEAAMARDNSLVSLRSQLTAQLESAGIPVVVLIDELDRVEDAEVKAVAQLVRSVADFPGISYVLAYDQQRVIEALGADAPDAERNERGRSYLEKIVQLQIPLPVTFNEEIERLLTAELTSLASEVGLPAEFKTSPRFQYFNQILVQHVISTPRDVKRLIGTLHAIGGMVRGEVDPIDLLGYCALLVKAPQTVHKLRADPDLLMEDTPSVAVASRRMAWDKKPVEERIAEYVPGGEQTEGVERLLGYLFPAFQLQRREDTHLDALSLRRPLLTVLRLGLLPGAFSRSQVEGLIDRMDDVYVDLTNVDHIPMWLAIGRFLRKEDRAWMTVYQPMHEAVRAFTEIIFRALKRKSTFRQIDAARIFDRLREEGEISLVSHLLYDCRKDGGDHWFLPQDQVVQAVEGLSREWKASHLQGDLLPRLWDLMPVYTMASAKTWDEECRAALDALIAADNRAVDGLSLLFYGGHYTVGVETVESICSRERYVQRVNQRLESGERMDESLRVALTKAAKGGWP